MSYVNPIWLEGQRRRWTRHDAHRFAPPVPPKSFAARRLEQRRADEELAAATAAQEEFEREVLALRRELASIRLDYELRRFHQKYSPNQPRVLSDAIPDNAAIPGAQYATSRSRGSGGGRTSDLEGGQAARLVEAQTRADAAISRVREIDPSWRPTPSFKETPEGSIRAYEAEAKEAQAYANELAGKGLCPGPFAGESIPARGPERSFTAAERGEIIESDQRLDATHAAPEMRAPFQEISCPTTSRRVL